MCFPIGVKMKRNTWTIEKRKRQTEIFVTNLETESIFIGEGYDKKEYQRSMELAKVICDALNRYEGEKYPHPQLIT
jgi:hypothetical protein|tara:strand:- start:619 stop:846 length:228 start_codon:yes stop_codon:yes gene_type:complete